MKLLIITNLFPNNVQPERGIFNKQQFQELAKLCELKVIAPIPWFPKVKFGGARQEFARVVPEEIIDGITVYHPRYLVTPKFGRALYGFWFYQGIYKKVKEIVRDFQCDAILATWAYPDAYAAALVAEKLKKPLVVKVHGSDINIATLYFWRRKIIQYALKKATKVIAVTESLKQKLIQLGIPTEKIVVIPNGVDTELFKPMNQQECRNKLFLPLNKKIVLFIGNLTLVKGIEFLIDAFLYLPSDVMLYIIGEGELKEKLKQRSSELQLFDRIKFVGKKPHSDIPIWMNASDVFCLPSLNEGCPNVVLEALACGKPVVASNVGGIPEIITSNEYGILVEPGNISAFAEALKKALSTRWDSQALIKRIRGRSWVSTAQNILKELACTATNKVKETFVNGSSSRELKLFMKETLQSILTKKYFMFHGDRIRQVIALTFDDGPDPEFTPQFLEILKNKEVKATFFLIGKNMEQHRDLTERIIREGHCVGIHSYSHRMSVKIDLRRKMDEVIKSRNLVNRIVGINCNLFRPPYGVISWKQLIFCLFKGITTVLWSIDSRDFSRQGVEDILNKTIRKGIRPGDIILFHDDNDFTLEALPIIIEKLKDEGQSFVTVDELFNHKTKKC